MLTRQTLYHILNLWVSSHKAIEGSTIPILPFAFIPNLQLLVMCVLGMGTFHAPYCHFLPSTDFFRTLAVKAVEEMKEFLELRLKTCSD